MSALWATRWMNWSLKFNMITSSVRATSSVLLKAGWKRRCQTPTCRVTQLFGLTDINLSWKFVGGGLCVYGYTLGYPVHRPRTCAHMTMKFWWSHFVPSTSRESLARLQSYWPMRPGAAVRIANSYNIALSRAVNQPVLLLGDFNFCDLSDHLPTLHQSDCPTRLARTLDKCYGNIPDAYKSTCRPALGKSDQKVTHLLPRYRAKLRREKTKETETWTEDCMEET